MVAMIERRQLSKSEAVRQAHSRVVRLNDASVSPSADRNAVIDEVVTMLSRMTGDEWTHDKRLRDMERPSSAGLQMLIAVERVKGMKS
jgi:hypothetical protein